MTEEINSLVQTAPLYLTTFDYFVFASMVILALYSVFLFTNLKNKSSLSLKIAAALPFLLVLLGVVWLIGDIFGNLFGLDFEEYLFIGVGFIWPISGFLSLVCSLIALRSSENRTPAIASATQSVLYIALGIIVLYNLGAH